MSRRRVIGDNTPAVYCEGKRCIQSYELAEKVARRSDSMKGDRRSPYRCRACSQWHLGSSFARRPERKRLSGSKYK